MVEAKLLYAIFVFVGTLTLLFSTAVFETTELTGLVNSTGNENLTFISTGQGVLNPPVCKFTQDDLVAQSGELFNCAGSYVGFMFGFATLSSGDPLLSILIVGIVGMVIFLAINLLVRIFRALPFT